MKNAVIAILIVVVAFLLFGLVRLAHKNDDLRRWNESLKAQVNDLTSENQRAESNTNLEPISGSQ